MFGQGSYLCRENYQTGYDYLCGSLYCYNKQIRKCAFSIAPQDSTLCGNGKWCEAQSCRRDPGALQTSDNCPLGDSKNPNVALGKSCSQIVTDRPSLCNDDKIGKTWCCESCGNLTRVDAANFTGPALSANNDCQATYGSESYFCMNDVHYSGSGYGDNMCRNMFCYDSHTGHCEAIPADDGVPCGNGQWCVGGKCINSTNAPADPMAGCYYGSQYQTFCASNIKYPKIASYCVQPVYEKGCCSFCLPHKNESLTGCEYGDVKPDICQAQVSAGTIKSYCLNNEKDCCQTCEVYKNGTDPNCPYGDADPRKCALMIEDNIGTGNCYNQIKRRECCETCAEYHNATFTGCEYGDHWQDYCAQNVKPPNVADACARYESQCCATCGYFRESGFPGCTYGDRDPAQCAALMNSTRGTAHCYDFSTQSLCCSTCHQLKDESTPNCLYGDTNPNYCKSLLNDSLGIGNCYDLKGQINCCRTCAEARNDTNKGCEYGDHFQEYCSKNIFSNETAFLCFRDEAQCCETCDQYVLSDLPDCKYGDKNPAQCRFMIPDEPTAAATCGSLSNRCCATCSMYGHPGIGGGISAAALVG